MTRVLPVAIVALALAWLLRPRRSVPMPTLDDDVVVGMPTISMSHATGRS